jgi:hypothetical protein
MNIDMLNFTIIVFLSFTQGFFTYKLITSDTLGSKIDYAALAIIMAIILNT